MNDDNVIVGTYEETGGAEHGFVTKDEGKHIRAINVPGACATEATAINDEGVIAGIYEKGSEGCSDHGFLKEGDDYETLELPTAATYKSTSAVCTGTYSARTGKCTVNVSSPDIRGLNDDGDVVGGFSNGGDLGFVFTDEKFRVLEVCTQSPLHRTTGASTSSEGCASGTTDGWGINDDYVVVGHYEDLHPQYECDPEDGCFYDNHHHGFIWTKEDGFKALYCDGDVFSNTDANGINDDGVIIGACDSSGFVLLPPYRDTDWTTFTVPEATGGQFSCPTNWTQGKTIAWGISNEGKIVGEYFCEENNFEKSYSFEVSLKTILHE